MTERWDPWDALRQYGEIELGFADLPAGIDGLYATDGEVAAIILGRHLDRRERRAVLTHELIHHEQGPPLRRHRMGGAWGCVTRRMERRTDRIATDRLVPFDELLSFCRRLAEVQGGVEPHDLCDEFDVPRLVAERALRQLLERREAG